MTVITNTKQTTKPSAVDIICRQNYTTKLTGTDSLVVDRGHCQQMLKFSIPLLRDPSRNT